MGHVVVNDRIADDHEERMSRTMEIVIGIALFALVVLGLLGWGIYRAARAFLVGYVG